MDSRLRGNDSVLSWRTSTATMDSRLRGNDSVLSWRTARQPWIPAYAGMTAVLSWRTRSPWIPAYAGVTVIPEKAGMWAPIMKQPALYIMTNKAKGTLYTGVTSNLKNRMWGLGVGSLAVRTSSLTKHWEWKPPGRWVRSALPNLRSLCRKI